MKWYTQHDISKELEDGDAVGLVKAIRRITGLLLAITDVDKITKGEISELHETTETEIENHENENMEYSITENDADNMLNELYSIGDTQYRDGKLAWINGF